MAAEERVAVVGMACRFPGAGTVGEYWSLLSAGAEAITRFSREDLVAAGADPEHVWREDFVPAKGVLSGARAFDWSFFGYSRAEAATIDPQQRLFLECAAQACDDAGIDPGRFPGWIGVYGGADRFNPGAAEGTSALTRVIGSEKDFLTTRVAYKLGLRGPAITVQTACSTSLTALHMAVQSLLAYECDAALAGGVAATPQLTSGYLYQEGGILSPDGHCRPFDEHAAGTVPSEGVGVVVLKRLTDALRDGDRIDAVVRGSAVNNDGGDKIGYTAPSVSGQRDVIRLAQKVSTVDPADIDYVEAHGTGTRIGDPVEVQALTDAFGGAGHCWLGAVKGNIGHPSAASGVAGLIKTVLMMRYRRLVPVVHYARPNPLLGLESTPFEVCTRVAPWPERGTPLAAVSSFGAGGTNAHVVLEGPPARPASAARPGPRLLALSTATPDASARLRADLADNLSGGPDPADLPRVARTLASRRRFAHRRAVVAEDAGDAVRVLREARDPGPARPLGRVAFLFPGYGTLRHPAAGPAYRLLPGFRGWFDEIRDTVRDRHGLDLSPVVDADVADPPWFSDIANQQLGLFATGYALGRQLREWGVEPVALLGNSIGEYAAATVAGVWEPADAASLVYERARAMKATAPGRMVAVNASAEEMARRLDPDGGVTVAVSAPDGVVLSGTRDAVDALLAGDALRGLDPRPLNIDQASHCAVMRPASAALRAAVAATPGRPPRLPLVSDATGDWADPEAARGPDHWAQQLLRPVRLDAAMGTVLAAGCDTFLELGPGSSMAGGLRRHPDWRPDGRTVPMLGRTDDGERGVLRALGTLWEHGLEAALDAVTDGPHDATLCALPTHPFAAHDPDVVPDAPPRAVAADRDPARAALEDLWCAALGVPSATDADDFFALGGDSLMAVNLAAQVRQRTAVPMSVAEFSAAPTFATLCRLAGRADTTPPVRVVPLAGGPDEHPLFLAAGATGTAVTYREMAGLLDRSVHGLEPVDTDLRHLSLEDLAAQHVDAIREVQGSGPYTLGGWSFGATVAHETARQLVERGERVELLVCLDGFVHGRVGVPAALDREFLVSSLRMEVGITLGMGSAGRQVRRVPGLRRAIDDTIRVLARYRPRPVPCPAVVFRAGADERAAARLRSRLRALYGGGVRVHPVAGDHWSMLAQPYVRELASRVRGALAEAVPA